MMQNNDGTCCNIAMPVTGIQSIIIRKGLAWCIAAPFVAKMHQGQKFDQRENNIQLYEGFSLNGQLRPAMV
jgi:hypothetical protein